MAELFSTQMDVLRQEIFLQKLATGMEKVLKSPRFISPHLLHISTFLFSFLWCCQHLILNILLITQLEKVLKSPRFLSLILLSHLFLSLMFSTFDLRYFAYNWNGKSTQEHKVPITKMSRLFALIVMTFAVFTFNFHLLTLSLFSATVLKKRVGS